MADKNIDGYYFYNEEDAAIANEEMQKIQYISEKIKEEDPKEILAVYDKMIQNHMFVTPVGYEYLHKLQELLFKSPEIEDERIADIPIRLSIAAAIRQQEAAKERPDDVAVKKKKKNYKQEYKASLVVNAVLAIVIAAMFAVALKSDHPNILNYRSALLNEYADWEQNLTEREAKLREKEAALEK
ncbi:MAG: hypothetical protein QM697_17460 [Lachnospiraceae bacterium]